MELDDYNVYAQTVKDHVTHTECIGSVELKVEAGWQDMPPEIEINGFIYKMEE